MKQQDNPNKNCHVVSTAASSDSQLIPLWSDDKFICVSSGACGQAARHILGWGIHVFLNGREASLEVDTGASGLLISRAVADRSGLKSAARIQIGGIGDQGAQGGFTAQVDSIRVGSLEFHDCTVAVTDRKDILVDGLIGTDVFSSYLVTLDYPMRKLILSQLPPRAGDTEVAALDTEAQEKGANSGPGGPQDRYIDPSMKDYAPVFRSGHFLILPVLLNGKTQRLFFVDSGNFSSSISPDAAREVTKVHGGSPVEIVGLSGTVAKVSTSDTVVLQFAGIQQQNNNLLTYDTSRFSRSTGTEVSGFLGNTILRELVTHIDYRDGLIKFDFDNRHGNRDYSH
jgi:hypothetical protein